MKLFYRTKTGQPGKITLPRICACIFFGFFLFGALMANLGFADQSLWIGFIHENSLRQFERGQQGVWEFLDFALRHRLIPWALLVALGLLSWGQPFFPAWFGWLGCSGGFLSASLIRRHGIKGILLMGGMGTPQYLIYAAAYIVLTQLAWAFQKQMKIRGAGFGKSKSRAKYRAIYLLFSALASGIFILGIFAEYYVNPFILGKM